MTNPNKAELRRLLEALPKNCSPYTRAYAEFRDKANPAAVLSLLDECDSMERFQTAYLEWQEKTDWVRWDIKPKELGMHVADVMTARITKAEAERDAALAELEACRKILDDVYLICPGQPGCGDFSRTQRTFADVVRYITRRKEAPNA